MENSIWEFSYLEVSEKILEPRKSDFENVLI